MERFGEESRHPVGHRVEATARATAQGRPAPGCLEAELPGIEGATKERHLALGSALADESRIGASLHLWRGARLLWPRSLPVRAAVKALLPRRIVRLISRAMKRG